MFWELLLLASWEEVFSIRSLYVPEKVDLNLIVLLAFRIGSRSESVMDYCNDSLTVFISIDSGFKH